MSKTYFIDSENVGDSWISLLAAVAPEDEILVFYTAKSPHMSYKSLITLKKSPKEVSFIECCEGNNALDFQLCTELGFRVHDISDGDFMIVSNDTGFDAVVKYWNTRNVRVKRITAHDCIATPLKIQQTKPVEELKPSEPVPVMAPVPMPAAIIPSGVEESAKEILYCIGKDDLPLLHDALKKLYGEKRGKQLYNAFKADTAYSNFLEKHQKLSQSERQALYCKILFRQGNMKMPADFPTYVMSAWKKKKNLNSLRSALQNKYAKDKYAEYYELIKVHIKILDKIK